MNFPARTDAQAHRHLLHPHHRRRPDRHRPGGGVRLFGKPGGQGAEKRGLSGHRRQFEPGDDHDRSGARRTRPTSSRSRPRSSPRSSRRSGPTRCFRRWAGRPRSIPRWRCSRTARSTGSASQLIGANAEAIEKAEDRLKFREAMDRIGLESPRSAIAHIDGGGHGGAGERRAAGDHPAELHAWRHRRRHRLQPRRISSIRPRRARGQSPTTEVLIEESLARLEGI